MSDFSKHIKKQDLQDGEMLRRSYEKLAESVGDDRVTRLFGADDLEMADGAVRACLRYCGAKPGNIPDGVSDLEERIENMCRPGGVMHRTVRLTPGWYRSSFGAMVGKLKTGEVVALLPRGTRGYAYRNPITYENIKLDKHTEKNLEDTAELFYPALPQRALEKGELFRFMFHSLDRWDNLKIVLISFISTFVGFLPAYATSLAFGEVAPTGQVRLILPIAALLLGVSVATLLLRMTRKLIMDRISIKIGTYTEAAVLARVLVMPSSFFSEYSSGRVASRISNVKYMVKTFVKVAMGGVLSLLFSLIYIVQVAIYAPSLTPLVMLIVVLQLAAIAVCAPQIIKYGKRMYTAGVSGTTTSLLKGMQKIKVTGSENRAFSKWADKYSKQAGYAYNRPKWTYCLEIIVTLIGMLGTLGIYMVAESHVFSVSDFMAFNAAYGQIGASIISLTAMVSSAVEVPAIYEYISPILYTAPESDDDKPSVREVSGEVEVNDLSFRYSEDEPWILQKLSFQVKAGEYVGIVGRSGCGKSTLVRLLLGFENPVNGSIMYGNYDLAQINARSLRRNAVGVVVQDDRLLRGDIYSNIILSSTNATIEDAWRAAEIAGIADDIRKMPMGMRTMVSEGGGGVSGGQRQRLIIARAVCSQRKILLLDEATSALDNITQKNVMDAMQQLDCTRIVFAHRLSTVQNCDRILVIDAGTICEEGTFDELIEKNGLFAELVAKQRLERSRP